MRRATFTEKRLIEFLAQIQAGPGYYLTAYLRPSFLPTSFANLIHEPSPLTLQISEALATDAVSREAQSYGTGAVILWSDSENKLIILPPFAVPEDKVLLGIPETMLLRNESQKERILGVVLITWGSYALGVFKGDSLVTSKIGTGYIHKRHRKGGRSEKRFARRTVEQKNDFLRKVANRIEERFRGHAVEQFYFGGNRLILKPLLQECPSLESQVSRISKRVLSVRYADREALLQSIEDVNKSVVFSF
jgi:hypothetical protein